VRHMKERMKDLYSWEMDPLKEPYEAEPMERSALKRGKYFVRRK